MWELRLILILIGVVFIAAVFLFSRQKKNLSSGFHRDAPSLGEANLPDVSFDSVPSALTSAAFAPDARTEPTAGSVAAGGDQGKKQLILTLHVASHDHAGFTGAAVLAALQAGGLQYGEYQVFHRLVKDAAEKSVFSVANMMEPGILDPKILPQMQVSGLTLFLLLPGPQEGVTAYANMLATAGSLARQLGGEVLDENRSTFTRQAARHIRERIIEFQGHAKLPAAD